MRKALRFFRPLTKVFRNVQETTDTLLPAQSSAEIIADAHELWNKSDHNAQIQDWSHWKGKGRWAEEKWRSVGEQHFKMYEDLCKLANHPRPIAKMIEWGPGGGANATRFSSEVTDYFGVDISAANLAECQTQVEEEGYKNFRPVLIDAAHPEHCLGHINSPVEFFLSTAVYQHFPSKEYGLEVTRLAYRLLSDSGIALIQTRFEDGTIRYKPKQRSYSRNVIYFTAYQIDEFWEIAVSIGFRPLSVFLNPKTRYAFYLLAK